MWPLESKEQQSLQDRKGGKASLSFTFQREKMKPFLWSWLTVTSVNLPQTIFWPKEICSVAFWNCYIQRPGFWLLLSKRYASSSAKARTWHKSPVWHMHWWFTRKYASHMKMFYMWCFAQTERKIWLLIYLQLITEPDYP